MNQQFSPEELDLQNKKTQIYLALIEYNAQQLERLKEKTKTASSDELLALALGRYDEAQKNINRSYQVISRLSKEEINLLATQVKIPEILFVTCVNLYESKKEQAKKTQATQKAKKSMQSLRPLCILAHLKPKATKKQLPKTRPQNNRD